MIMRTAISIVFLLLCSPLFAEEAPVTVRHLAPTKDVFKQGYFPHMWFYRTEITNNTKLPLRVVWFDAYIQVEGKWYASNVLGRVMRSEDFSTWYREGDTVNNGVIFPGKTAACDVNWHAGATEQFVKTKWSYILVDNKGNDYFVEKEVDPLAVEYMNYSSENLLNRDIWGNPGSPTP